MKTKFAIGCLVQWYEIEMIQEYVDSLKDAIKMYEGEVIVDLMLSKSTDLEKPTFTSEEMNNIEFKVYDMFHDLQRIRDGVLVFVNSTVSNYSIADYRRDFNDKFCTQVDVLIWGESDMLVPAQAFNALDILHQQQGTITPKYLATFGICKMWDASWKPLEHVAFTDKPFIDGDTENWWSLRYTMSKEEMDKINNVETLDVTTIQPHKFNGCGLVISSEVIKSGVNIPKSVFFVHEDTALMLMTNKILGNIPQYHFRNILVVHNRKHSKKRSYILGEEGIDKTNTGKLREVHPWYNKANRYSEENCYNLFNAKYKSKTWEDVWSK
jgi:hypothetical protein